MISEHTQSAFPVPCLQTAPKDTPVIGKKVFRVTEILTSYYPPISETRTWGPLWGSPFAQGSETNLPVPQCLLLTPPGSVRAPQFPSICLVTPDPT